MRESVLRCCGSGVGRCVQFVGAWASPALAVGFINPASVTSRVALIPGKGCRRCRRVVNFIYDAAGRLLPRRRSSPVHLHRNLYAVDDSLRSFVSGCSMAGVSGAFRIGILITAFVTVDSVEYRVPITAQSAL